MIYILPIRRTIYESLIGLDDNVVQLMFKISVERIEITNDFVKRELKNILDMNDLEVGVYLDKTFYPRLKQLWHFYKSYFELTDGFSFLHVEIREDGFLLSVI